MAACADPGRWGYGAQLVRDAKGTRQVAVLTTALGRVVGVATWSGRVVWAHTVTAVDGPVHCVLVRPAAGHAPVAVVVAPRQSATAGALAASVLALDPVTGALLPDAVTPAAHAAATWMPQWVHAVRPTADGEGHGILLVDSHGHALLLPVHMTHAAAAATAAAHPDDTAAPVLHGVLHFYGAPTPARPRVVGVTVWQNDDGSVRAQPAWELPLPDTEHLAVLAARPRSERVASAGRVLGSRQVLYKYLNPHLFLVATIDPGPSPCLA
jgi:ER membrane protein complex subunit 1